MSSTNRGAERRPADNYPSPPWIVRAVYTWLLRYGYVTPETPIVDPCAGDGAVLHELRRLGHVGYQRAIELRPECVSDLVTLPGLRHVHCPADALTSELRPWPNEVTITNPPFSSAQGFVEIWTPAPSEPTPAVVAMLLPTGFLGGGGRATWWPRHRPAHLLLLSDRPAFVAVCKGKSATATTSAAKGCGRPYPLGTKGRCECGGSIGDGTDSCTYAWTIWARETRPCAPAFDWLRRDDGGAR